MMGLHFTEHSSSIFDLSICKQVLYFSTEQFTGNFKKSSPFKIEKK